MRVLWPSVICFPLIALRSWFCAWPSRWTLRHSKNGASPLPLRNPTGSRRLSSAWTCKGCAFGPREREVQEIWKALKNIYTTDIPLSPQVWWDCCQSTDPSHALRIASSRSTMYVVAERRCVILDATIERINPLIVSYVQKCKLVRTLLTVSCLRLIEPSTSVSVYGSAASLRSASFAACLACPKICLE